MSTDMTRVEATEITGKISDAINVAWELIIEAYQRRAWVALGYDNWDAYTSAEFGHLRLRLPREERQEIVASMREAGMSIRAIASATGASKNTIHGDLSQSGTGSVEVIGTDGKAYHPASPVDRAVAVLDGMTDEERDEVWSRLDDASQSGTPARVTTVAELRSAMDEIGKPVEECIRRYHGKTTSDGVLVTTERLVEAFHREGEEDWITAETIERVVAGGKLLIPADAS